ncbi:hypothetical protein [Methylobacterium sp. yr668]|uniref:hypothetical protein n=1 Tax=Methylobacterium sp. yr668 TaxID=1761801 RepID=UPI001114F09B|nr:hypothetical protein [Methylobacterium sp. yr668]
MISHAFTIEGTNFSSIFRPSRQSTSQSSFRNRAVDINRNMSGISDCRFTSINAPNFPISQTRQSRLSILLSKNISPVFKAARHVRSRKEYGIVAASGPKIKSIIKILSNNSSYDGFCEINLLMEAENYPQRTTIVECARFVSDANHSGSATRQGVTQEQAYARH